MRLIVPKQVYKRMVIDLIKTDVHWGQWFDQLSGIIKTRRQEAGIKRICCSHGIITYHSVSIPNLR